MNSEIGIDSTFPPTRAAIAEITQAYMPLVRSVASTLYRELPPGACVDLLDLVQMGAMGLIQAARSYQPACGASFGYYARWRIRGEMMDSLRRMDWLSRGARRVQKGLAAAGNGNRACPDSQRPAVQDEVGADVQSSSGSDFIAAFWKKDLRPLCESEIPGVTGDSPDHMCLDSEVQRLLGKAKEGLPVRHRELISLHYEYGFSMKQIAGILNITASRVSQMHREALQAMARSLANCGISCAADLGCC